MSKYDELIKLDLILNTLDQDLEKFKKNKTDASLFIDIKLGLMKGIEMSNAELSFLKSSLKEPIKLPREYYGFMMLQKSQLIQSRSNHLANLKNLFDLIKDE